MISNPTPMLAGGVVMSPLAPRPGDSYGGRPMTLDECAQAERLLDIAIPTPPGGIGDINSTAKGTGARFNSGKPDLSMLPLTLLAGHLRRTHPDSIHVDALEDLGHFQETHDPTWLHRCAETLGADGWEECAHVFTYGAKKYAAWNWAKGMPWSVPLACAARHIYLGLLVGEQVDRESNHPHRGHVFCNLTMLLQYVRDYPEGNDLPPKGLL